MTVLVDTKYYGDILRNARRNQSIKTRDAANQYDSYVVMNAVWTRYPNTF